ncbi:MAG: peptidase E [Anaerolineae bacterium]
MQIIAMGGGGFSMEPDHLALDRYIVEQTGVERPKVCFLPQASGEAPGYIINFYKAFSALNCIPSHLSLFTPHTADLAGFLMSQNLIYVGGGNTKSMLALWREWGLDRILRDAAEAGTVLAGISAGGLCWFDYGLNEIVMQKSILPGLGYVKGACAVHYDDETVPSRAPYHEWIGSGKLPSGVAFDDYAAGHYLNGELVRVVASRPNRKGYRVQRTAEGVVQETALETTYLS